MESAPSPFQAEPTQNHKRFLYHYARKNEMPLEATGELLREAALDLDCDVSLGRHAQSHSFGHADIN
jgi:hypothetical protein